MVSVALMRVKSSCIKHLWGQISEEQEHFFKHFPKILLIKLSLQQTKPRTHYFRERKRKKEKIYLVGNNFQ